MTKESALYQWLQQFLTFYPEAAVPLDAQEPYGTYTPVSAAYDSAEVSITVNLWYRTESEAAPTAKAQEIARAIGPGGVLLRCDGGYIWLKRGSPFVQAVAYAEEPALKRRYINITAQYLVKD